MARWLVVHHGIGGDGAHHLVPASAPRDRAREIHQSAAFGVYRQSAANGFPDLAAQGGIGLQTIGVRFRKAAADKKGVGWRQAAVRGGIKKTQPRSGPVERLEIVRIVEVERAVTCDRETDVLRRADAAGSGEPGRSPAPRASSSNRSRSRLPTTDWPIAASACSIRGLSAGVASPEVALLQVSHRDRGLSRRSRECLCSARPPGEASSPGEHCQLC